MKEYIKPILEDEDIELEDVIAQSLVEGPGSADSDGQSDEYTDLF